jgi:hypothetical protein
MQQRRLRLGDILDDYCPRERRVTNHVVVAMVDDDVKQTRCTTCDAEHEYKQAKVPAPRRRKPAGALADVVDSAKPRVLAAQAPPGDDEEQPPAPAEPFEPSELSLNDTRPEPEPNDDVAASEGGEDEWPVHRPLIRATLPRPEGQVPERKAPDFTFRQSGGRGFDANRNGQRQRGGHRPMRQAQGQGQSGQSGPPGRFGNTRHGTGQPHGQRSGHPQRHGSGEGPQGGNRAGQPSRGPRAGGGHGRKRGR